jgi:hypothetical protein
MQRRMVVIVALLASLPLSAATASAQRVDISGLWSANSGNHEERPIRGGG